MRSRPSESGERQTYRLPVAGKKKEDERGRTTNTNTRGVRAKTLLMSGRVNATVTRWAYSGTGEHGYWRKEGTTGTVFGSQFLPPAASCLTTMVTRNVSTCEDQPKDNLPTSDALSAHRALEGPATTPQHPRAPLASPKAMSLPARGRVAAPGMHRH